MSEQLIERVKTVYQQLNKDSITLVKEVYAPDIEFVDPFHQINGLPAFERYIAQMYENVQSIHFEYGSTFIQDKQAMLTWTMTFQHPRLNNGQAIVVPGSTFLGFDEKIFYHRDYFDAGAMLYEQLPIMRFIIAKIRARLAA